MGNGDEKDKRADSDLGEIESMIKIMTIFMYVATILAIGSTAIVAVNYLVETKTKQIDFMTINKHIKTCRRASLVFTALVWLANSFEQRSICIKGYLELSATCLRLGFFWLVYAFVCIAICILMVSIKKEQVLINNISKFRNSGFIMGAVFLIISFLLNVK